MSKKTGKIIIYKLKNGKEVCRVDISNEKKPVTFSDLFPSFKNLIIETEKVSINNEEENDNGDIE